MGKRIRKGTRGEAALFITRSQALKKLQLTLREFRRLCILKGIFPKEPKKKFKGTNKTYYYSKDIRFLGHEKLLEKFRELKIFERKIKKAKAKNQKFDLQKLQESKPTYSIDHILKERYPRFMDAINDLDDALCLISLFASLPKHELLNIKSETISECQRLLREFYLYCAVSKNFRKGFISIKGIYLNVEVMNYDVVWLSPIHTQQKLTFDIDYEIMTNFLELYMSLMKFVNLKLYKDIGMDYPPPKENYDMTFFGLNALDINQIQNKVSVKSEIEKNKVNKNKKLN
jgi:pescadillo protein